MSIKFIQKLNTTATIDNKYLRVEKKVNNNYNDENGEEAF